MNSTIKLATAKCSVSGPFDHPFRSRPSTISVPTAWLLLMCYAQDTHVFSGIVSPRSLFLASLDKTRPYFFNVPSLVDSISPTLQKLSSDSSSVLQSAPSFFFLWYLRSRILQISLSDLLHTHTCIHRTASHFPAPTRQAARGLLLLPKRGVPSRPHSIHHISKNEANSRDR